MKIDLSRPDFVYASIWGLVYCLSYFIESDFRHDFPPEISILILTNIVSFFVIYRIFQTWFGASTPRPWRRVDDDNLQVLKRFISLLFKIWVVFYLVTIVLSDGLPAYWVLSGDSRTYVDFGVPTLTGLLNMIRAFMFAGSILLFMTSGNRRYLRLPAILIFTALLEVSRGGLTVLLLHGVGVYVLCRKNSMRPLLMVSGGLILFIIMFGLLADFRGEHVPIEDIAGGDSIFVSLPAGFFWVYTYITTPINNVNFAYTMGIDPLYYPHFSVSALVPTVVRDIIFPELEYPIALADDAFNATSFYSPLLADFGVFGAGVVVTLLQAVVSYVHVKAVRGDVFHFLIYPVLFMCIVLSTFYMFFFSMVTVMYPVLVYCFIRYRHAGARK
jgi:oligosaccharide repeat unit polymerase